MNTLQNPFVRLGLLFVGAATVLGGHDLLSGLLFEPLRASPAAGGLASVGASLVVWLLTGVFVLPMLRHLLGARQSHAAGVVLGTALAAVAARAAVEAAAGVTLVGLPLLSLAAAIAIVGGRSSWRRVSIPAVAVKHTLAPVAAPAVPFALPRSLPGRLPHAS